MPQNGWDGGSRRKIIYSEGSFHKDQSSQKFAVDESRPTDGSPKRSLHRPVDKPKGKIIVVATAVMFRSPDLPRPFYGTCRGINHFPRSVRARGQFSNAAPCEVGKYIHTIHLPTSQIFLPATLGVILGKRVNINHGPKLSEILHPEQWARIVFLPPKLPVNRAALSKQRFASCLRQLESSSLDSSGVSCTRFCWQLWGKRIRYFFQEVEVS